MSKWSTLIPEQEPTVGCKGAAFSPPCILTKQTPGWPRPFWLFHGMVTPDSQVDVLSHLSSNSIINSLRGNNKHCVISIGRGFWGYPSLELKSQLPALLINWYGVAWRQPVVLVSRYQGFEGLVQHKHSKTARQVPETLEAEQMSFWIMRT